MKKKDEKVRDLKKEGCEVLKDKNLINNFQCSESCRICPFPGYKCRNFTGEGKRMH